MHRKRYQTKLNRLIFIFKELLDRWLSIMFHILKIILLILYLDGQITTVSVSAPILSKKAAAASPKSLSTQKCVSNQWKGVTELNPIQADVWLTQNSLGGKGVPGTHPQFPYCDTNLNISNILKKLQKCKTANIYCNIKLFGKNVPKPKVCKIW